MWVVEGRGSSVELEGFGIGRLDRVKTSPERSRGILGPNSEARRARASVLMGVEEGVYRVRGWMVMKSTRGSFGSPITVFIKSNVFLAYGLASRSQN